MGRTEQFAEMRFQAPQQVGSIVDALVEGVNGVQLMGSVQNPN
jgi:hypothetical protein